MDILGVGPMELVLVLILALLIFGPEDLVSAGRKMGRFFNKIVKSETWMAVRSISREMRNLPNKLAREAELEELSKDLQNQTIAPPPRPTSTSTTSPSQDTETGNPENLKAWTAPPSSGDKGEDSGAQSSSDAPQEDANENVSD